MAGPEERTEQATPRKRQEAREKGQVAKSMEVNAAVVLLAGIITLKYAGDYMVTMWRQYASESLLAAGTFSLTLESIQTEMLRVGVGFARMTMPILIAAMVAGLAANVLQSGFILSAKPLAPDYGRLNIAQGLARMFSQRSAVDLGKSLLKSFIIGYIIYTFFRDHSGDILALISTDPHLIAPLTAKLSIALLLKSAITLFVIACIDYGYQRWQFEKSLRMTKQEIKEEYKRSEGDPLIKSFIRQRQREMARRRMMSDVSKAHVVLTNPTHLAVALRYEPTLMAAPVIVAKGQRLIAEKIKKTARQHRIPVIENKALARTLFAQCNVGQTVPVELFQAVAEILAFVFKQSGRTTL